MPVKGLSTDSVSTQSIASWLSCQEGAASAPVPRLFRKMGCSPSAEGSFDETTACALERPEIPSNLSKPEQLAIELGDRFATDHLTIDGEFFDRLKVSFSEPEIIELLMHCALYVGMGRLASVLDMTEDLPNGFAKPFGENVKLSADKPLSVA